MTSSRIDSLIADSGRGTQKNYAEKWITSINPTDFINLTTDEIQDREVFGTVKGDYVNDLIESNTVVYDKEIDEESMQV